jgi:hypothetical protein
MLTKHADERKSVEGRSGPDSNGSKHKKWSRRACATGEGYDSVARRHQALAGRALTGPSGWDAPFTDRLAVALHLPGLNPAEPRGFSEYT